MKPAYLLYGIGLLFCATGCADLSLHGKHSCSSNADCLEGRVCSDELCVSPGRVFAEDGGAAEDAESAVDVPLLGDASAEPDAATPDAADAPPPDQEAGTTADTGVPPVLPVPPGFRLLPPPGDYHSLSCVSIVPDHPADFTLELKYSVSTDGSEPDKPLFFADTQVCGPWKLGGVQLRFAWYTRDGTLVSEPERAFYNVVPPAITSAQLSGSPAKTLDVVHFRVETGEPGGYVSLTSTAWSPALRPTDDGLNGDKVAGDGVYELDWLVPPSLSATDLLVTARFTDSHYNVTALYPLSNRLTLLAEGIEIKSDVTVDTVWDSQQGPLILTGERRVVPDVQLTIAPGTRLRFFPGSSLEVRGTLRAVGTAAAPITIERADIRVHGLAPYAGPAFADDGSYLRGQRFEHVLMRDGAVRLDVETNRTVYMRNVELERFVAVPNWWSPGSPFTWAGVEGSYLGFSRIHQIGASAQDSSALAPESGVEPANSRFEQLYVDQLYLAGIKDAATITRSKISLLIASRTQADGLTGNVLTRLIARPPGTVNGLHGNVFARSPDEFLSLDFQVVGYDGDLDFSGNGWPPDVQAAMSVGPNQDIAVIRDSYEDLLRPRMRYAPLATDLVAGPDW